MPYVYDPKGRHFAAALGALALLAAPLALSSPATAQATAQAPTLVADAAATPTAEAPAAAPTPAEQVEHHIADLHAELQISPAQETLWKPVADAMRQNAARIDALFDQRAAQQEKMNAIQDLHSYAAITETRAEDVRRFIPLFEKLYDSMSPEQKKNADDVFRAAERRHEAARAAHHE